MSLFEKVDQAPEDPILSLPSAFARESNPRKVNLGAGIFKNAAGKSCLLKSVHQAEKQLAKKPVPKDYSPIDGDPQFIALTLNLIFGTPGMQNGVERIIGLQTVGGTGALELGGHFINQVGIKTIYISDPSWNNHETIFAQRGFKIEHYPYYNSKKNGIDFEAMCAAIKKMPAKSAIVLHACCHNPTGFDLTHEQWKIVAKLLRDHDIFPFVDIAYQGFGESLEADLFAIYHFLEQELEFFVAYSFSKNFGLYGERVGLLGGVFDTPEIAARVRSQLKVLIRASYSNPPIHGSAIVSTILSQPKLKKLWIKELGEMRARLQDMRNALFDAFDKRGKGDRFSFLQEQKGLFSFCGLTHEQAKRLRGEFAIYLLSNGRINVAGLNSKNIDYTADSLLKVME